VRLARLAAGFREHRHLRPAHDIGFVAHRRRAHALEPQGIGDLVIVDDGEMGERRENGERGLPAGIVGAAIAALVRDDEQAFHVAALEQRGRGLRPFARAGFVLDDDDGKAPAGLLVLQRGERIEKLLRPAKGGHRHDQLDRFRHERGRTGDGRDACLDVHEIHADLPGLVDKTSSG
jgi:hypothetical protein